MTKHKLNYNIIREALGEYLNNDKVIPMYNKKQIKEEAYKLEDLENSKAFIIDKSNKKNLKVDCLVSRESLYEVLTSFMKTNLNRRLIARLDIKKNRLIKGVHLEG